VSKTKQKRELSPKLEVAKPRDAGISALVIEVTIYNNSILLFQKFHMMTSHTLSKNMWG
jgi:hypothetical protein